MRSAPDSSASRLVIHPGPRRRPVPRWRSAKRRSARWRTASTSASTSRASSLAAFSSRSTSRAQLLHAVRGDLDAEVLGGHVLEEVGLVEDHRVVGGDDLAVAARVLHREVGAEQVVVHDHEVGLERALAHAGHPAGVEVGAGLADAVLARGRDLAPEVHGVGQVRDLRAVAGVGVGSPVLDGPEERDLVEAPEAARLRRRSGSGGGRGSCRGPSSPRRERSRPRARARSGRSLSTSCSCRFLVPVETTTRRPSSTAGRR